MGFANSIYVNPEYKLVLVGKDSLHIKPIGVNQDFIELSGHSLLTPQTVNRITTELNVEIPLLTFLRIQRLKEL